METPPDSLPLVSVVIIFLNERRFLNEAIESVLGQTYPRWELLLVDDGSSDGSTELAWQAVIRNPERIRYLDHPSHENRGMSASRNLGWSQGQGELIAFLDADDVWLPAKLERQVDLLRTHAVDMVYGDTQFWYGWTGDPQDVARDCQRGIGIPPNTVVTPPDLMLQCFPLGRAPSPATCSMLIRREMVERIGGYETAFRGLFEDQAFLAKLYLHATVFVSGECHDRYRMRVDSCVSRSAQAGRIADATHLFLQWLEIYLKRQGMGHPAVAQSLRQALWPYRHPYLRAAWTFLRGVCRQLRHGVWRRHHHLARLVRQKPTGAITAVPNPVVTSDRFAAGATRLSWRSSRTDAVEIRVDAPDGVLLSRSTATGHAETGRWVRDGMCFYLQDVTNDRPLTSAQTLDVVRVRVVSAITPSVLAPSEMPPDVHAPDGAAEDAAPPALGPAGVAAQTVRRRSSGGTDARAVILLYHRIAEVTSDPWTLAVTPAHFAEHLQVLKERLAVLSLSHLSEALRDGTLSDRSVVVTFDDGYADNLHVAKPLLERYNVPATVFVTTGALADARGFWWDDLDRLLLQTGSLPRTLHLTIAGEGRRWELGDEAEYHEDTRRLHRYWRAWGSPDPTVRHRLFREIYEQLYPLHVDERRRVIDELLAWGGPMVAAPDRLSLTPDEVARLGRGGLVEVGAHTVTHSLMVVASTTHQRWEIEHSKRELERIVGHPVVSFAYPFGKRGDYGDETVALVRSAGFESACSNFSGIVSRGVDVLQLPRMFMGDWNGEELGGRLTAWFGG